MDSTLIFLSMAWTFHCNKRRKMAFWNVIASRDIH